MVCTKCGKEFKAGETCIEILRGEIIDNISVNSIETQAVLCEVCEDEVFPALWADINELTKDGHDDFSPLKHR